MLCTLVEGRGLPVRLANTRTVDTLCGDAVVVKFVENFVLFKASVVTFKLELFKGFEIFVVFCSSGVVGVFVVFAVVFVAVFSAKPATSDNSVLSGLFSPFVSLSDKLSA